MTNVVEHHYDTHSQMEWGRLERHPMEFALTWKALQEFLPPAPARILDVGGGTGRYAIALAKEGYDVTLFDLSQGNLAFAQDKAHEAGVTLSGYIHGSATDLSRFAEGSFDAAMLMGPLYHLLELEQRRQAAAEARRVLRPGGVCFASFITRYAAVLDAAVKDRAWIVEHRQECDELLRTGIARPDPDIFTDAYFAHPTEVVPLMESVGFQTGAVIAVEGVTALMNRELHQTESADVIQAWVEMNYRQEKDPSTHGHRFICFIPDKSVRTTWKRSYEVRHLQTWRNDFR